MKARVVHSAYTALTWRTMHYARRAMNQSIVNVDSGKAAVSRHIYGHFAEYLGRCIYSGLWVGENPPSRIHAGPRRRWRALRAVRIRNLRWPGGCFADEYHWIGMASAPANSARL